MGRKIASPLSLQALLHPATGALQWQQNAVHHGLVPVANQYPWCSAAWFERVATPAQIKTIYNFKIDRLQIYDEYTPEW